MPPPAARPPELLDRVFRGTAAVAAGLLTRDQLRSAAWRRLRRDVYADARMPLDHTVHARGVHLVAPAGTVFAGLTAVVLWGGRGFACADDPVEVIVPAGLRWQPGPGVVVRSGQVGRDVVRGAHGLCRTDRVRTAVDLIRRGAVDDGVVLLDRLVAGGIVALTPVRDAVAALPRCRGSRLAREIADLADGRLGRDRRRLNRLRAAGWTVFFVTAADMHHPVRLVAELAAVVVR